MSVHGPPIERGSSIGGTWNLLDVGSEMTANWQGPLSPIASFRGSKDALHSTPLHTAEKHIRHNFPRTFNRLISLRLIFSLHPHIHFPYTLVSIIPVYDPGNDLHPALAISPITLGQIAQNILGPHSNLCSALIHLTSHRPCFHLHHLARRPFVAHLHLNPKKKNAPETHCPGTGRGPHPAQGLVPCRRS